MYFDVRICQQTPEKNLNLILAVTYLTIWLSLKYRIFITRNEQSADRWPAQLSSRSPPFRMETGSVIEAKPKIPLGGKMSKSTKASLLVMFLLIASACTFHSARAQFSADDRAFTDATIFVQGHHAYVIDIGITTPVAALDSCWLRIFDIEDSANVSLCCSLYVKGAREGFVADDYLYVAVHDQSWYVVLYKYDVSDPCNPTLISSANSYSRCLWITDMYVTYDKAYVSMDYSGVVVFDVSGTNVVFDEYWSTPETGSPQGIHVRLPHAYVGSEALDLWIRDTGDSCNYTVRTTNICRDVYNVGYADSGASLTYEAATDSFLLWDTTDPNDITLVGSVRKGGPICQMVHVTGDWVYRLGSSNKVQVYPLEYAVPSLHTTYTAPGQLCDVHVVHERYISGPLNPIYGTAHIIGVCDISGSAVIWIHSPGSSTQRVEGFKYGDVNEDGNVNIGDVICLVNYTLKGYNGSVESLDAADINCDGEINTYDFYYLMDYIWYSGPDPGADCDFYHDW